MRALVVGLWVAGCVAGPEGVATGEVGAKESSVEHCDGEDNDLDGTVDEDCDVCERIVTRGRSFWRTARCVIDGDATGTPLVPVVVGGSVTYSTGAAVTSYLRMDPGSDTRRRLGQQLVVGRLNVAAFHLGELTWHDVDGDGVDETIAELLDAGDAIYTTGTSAQRASWATLLGQLAADGEAFGLWFDPTCVAAAERCNGIDDDGDGTTDEDCSCEGNRAPGAPAVTVAEVDEGDGRVGLLCAWTDAVDPDGDPLAHTVAWTVDGVPWTDAGTTTVAGDTIPATDAARGRDWTCTVTADDGRATTSAADTWSFDAPARGGYAFERVTSGLDYPSDLAVLPDGTLLVSDLLGTVSQVDPSDGSVLGAVSILSVGAELRSVALHPDFGDGLHDWLYVWASQDTDLYRFDLSLDPLALSGGTVVLDVDEGGGGGSGGDPETPIFTSGSGGGLVFWGGETGDPTTLWLGVGPVRNGWDAQDDDNLGGKLLALQVDDVTGEVSGGAVDGGTADDRIAAMGLRNPWRATDCGAALCIADPGSNTYEELQLYTAAGANYGFPRTEGGGDPRWDDPAIWWGDEDPTWSDDSPDGSRASLFSNVPWISPRLGGEGYGGRLDGWALYGDFYDGWVRAAEIDATGAHTGRTEAVAQLQFVMKVVEVDGVVYALELGGTLNRLVLRADRQTVGPVGELLSSTDYAGALPYGVRYALWSNGADKERFLSLPSGTTVDNGTEPWTYPDGTRLYKTFSVDGVNIETRVIERIDGRWVPGVYRWDGADARLSEGYTEEVALASGGTYTVPSTEVCAECHDARRGGEWPLGLEPFVLGNGGLRDLASVLATPAAPAPSASGDANTRRVRSYLHTNCAFCHSPEGIVSQMSVIAFDLSYDATIDTTLVANYYEANPNAGDGDPIVDPADPTASVLYRVIADAEMPYLSVWEPDTSILGPLETWIAAQ